MRFFVLHLVFSSIGQFLLDEQKSLHLVHLILGKLLFLQIKLLQKPRICLLFHHVDLCHLLNFQIFYLYKTDNLGYLCIPHLHQRIQIFLAFCHLKFLVDILRNLCLSLKILLELVTSFQ